jgi:ABC-type multidrug transport system fused ATPase/permease subunit
MAFLSLLHFLLLDYTKHKDKIRTWDVMAPKWRKLYYMDFVTKNFDYAKDIRMFSMEGWLHKKQKYHHDDAHQLISESKDRWIKCILANDMIYLVQEGVLYAWLIFSVLFRGVTIANVFLYFGSIRTFADTLTAVLDSITDMRRRNMEINDFRTFTEYPEEDIHNNHRHVPNGVKPEFTFEHVSFRYPGQDKYALLDLNLTIQAGKRLAVVGRNGAGKTTFIKLLCRLYEPTEGKIYLNGTDIMEYDIDEYYELIAPVFQNVECFAFPFSENVSMKTKEDTDGSEAERCLKLAGLDDKLRSLTKGVQTEILKVLHDDGIDLSGGEKQKLALARAIYKNAPVVVLDEPTAALDALAEYKLYMDFDKLIGKKTAIYISHRLSSTRFCHAIAMFKDGKMVEYGTHEELLDLGKEYAQMFRVQAQYYLEDNDENRRAASGE